MKQINENLKLAGLLGFACVFGFAAALLTQPIDFSQYNNSASRGLKQYVFVRPAKKTAPDPNCPIKAKAKSKIYHSAGQQNYAKLKADICFASEAAAQAQGYVRSKR